MWDDRADPRRRADLVRASPGIGLHAGRPNRQQRGHDDPFAGQPPRWVPGIDAMPLRDEPTGNLRPAERTAAPAVSAGRNVREPLEPLPTSHKI